MRRALFMKTGTGSGATTGYTIAITPSSLYEYASNGAYTTASVTAAASGGTGPYTYAWTRDDGSPAVNANSIASATTSFNSTGTNVVRTATWEVTSTDATAKLSTARIEVNVEHGNPSDEGGGGTLPP